jgi:hypothetical protein
MSWWRSAPNGEAVHALAEVENLVQHKPLVAAQVREAKLAPNRVHDLSALVLPPAVLGEPELQRRDPELHGLPARRLEGSCFAADLDLELFIG